MVATTTPDTGKGVSEAQPKLMAPEKHRSSQQPASEQEEGNVTAPNQVAPADDPPPSLVLEKKGIKLLNRKIFKALEGLGIERNRTLNELIAKYPESQVWSAIGVLKINLDKAYSPVGLFIKALRDGWHLDNRNDLPLENPVKIFPPNFKEAYERGVKLGYFEDVPMDNLSFFNYEPQVWVRNPNDRKGFTSMSWSEAIEFIGFG